MKLMTILGTRPEIIRLSLIIKLLDDSAEHVLVHTGQNYDERLSEVFFNELEIRRPDVCLGVRGARFGEQVGQILTLAERLLLEQRPDRLLILGDTNSGLAALAARRLGIPVYHMEAGNRCFDDRVPEEVNRRVIDHASSVLLPYTERSRVNLLREGIAGERIYVTGNPIKEVIEHYAARRTQSAILDELGLTERHYFLVTLHRAENVDDEGRLRQLVAALAQLPREFGFPVICSLHPRTQAKAQTYGVDLARAGVRFLPPFGFGDFLRLEERAACVLTDSGTVQEEACLFQVPAVTLRDVTERPETIECGSNVLAGCAPQQILRLVKLVTQHAPAWRPPPEYEAPQVALTVCRILLGFRLPDTAERVWRGETP